MANHTENTPDPEYAKWRRELECVKQKIATRGARDLRTLDEAGVPRAAILELLTLTATRTGGMIDVMRNRRDRLKSLAARMENLGSDLGEALRDPLMRMSYWAYYQGFGSLLGMEVPKAWTWEDTVTGAFLGPSTMRSLAKMFRGEAKKFSLFLRKYGRADSQKSVAILLSQVYWFRLSREAEERRAGRPFVKLTPKRGPDYLDVLARLLTDAFEAVGVNKSGKQRSPLRSDAMPRPDEDFSPEGLSQVWKRTGYGMLAIWLRNAGVLEKSPPKEPVGANLPIGTPLLGQVQREPASFDTSSQ